MRFIPVRSGCGPYGSIGIMWIPTEHCIETCLKQPHMVYGTVLESVQFANRRAKNQLPKRRVLLLGTSVRTASYGVFALPCIT